MKRLAMIAFAAVGIAAGAGAAVSGVYHRTPLPEALIDLERKAPGTAINFTYSKIEDYTVSGAIDSLPVRDALERLVGFYPIRVVEKDSRTFFVQPLFESHGMMHGRLVTAAGEPVEYASVRLFEPGAGGRFLSGGVSNADGAYAIPIDVPTVRAQIACLGYAPLDTVLSTGIAPDIVMHRTSTYLRELTVEAPLLERRDGRFISVPNLLVREHSADIFSMIAQLPLPGIFVDGKNITSFGESVIIEVDGIQRSAAWLERINHNRVARIEYSYELPAKYLSSGARAIIYIYLQEPVQGGSAYISFSPDYTVSAGDLISGVSLNYRKSEFSLDYRLGYNNYGGIEESSVERFCAPDMAISNVTSGRDGRFNRWRHTFFLYYTLRWSPSMVWIASGQVDIDRRSNRAASAVRSDVYGDYGQVSRSGSKSSGGSLQVYGQKKFGSGASLEVKVNGSYSSDDYTRNLIDNYPGGEAMQYPNDIDACTTFLQGQVTYTRPFASKYSFNIGASDYWQRTDNTYLRDGSRMDNSQNHASLYGGVDGTSGRLRWAVASYVQYHHDYNNRNARNDMWGNYTTVNLGMNWSKWSWSVRGFYSATSPNISAMTDYEIELNRYLVANGNPGLRNGHMFELTPQVYYTSGKFWASLNTNVSYGHDFVYQRYTYLGNGRFLRRNEDMDMKFQVRPTLSAGLNQVLDKHLSLKVSAGVDYSRMHTIDTRRSLTRPFVECNIGAFLGKWSISATYGHRAPSLYAETITRRSDYSSMSVMYRFDKNWLVQLYVNNFTLRNGPWTRSDYIGPVYQATTFRCEPAMGAAAGIWVKYTVDFGRRLDKVRGNYGASISTGDTRRE